MLNFSPLFKLHTPWRFYEGFSPSAQNEQVKEMTEAYSKYLFFKGGQIFFTTIKNFQEAFAFKWLKVQGLESYSHGFLREFFATNLNYRETT